LYFVQAKVRQVLDLLENFFFGYELALAKNLSDFFVGSRL
jgi:hypothetical protein